MINYLSGWRRFDITRADTVLEIGSGDHPLIRSDILCDRFPESSFERYANLPLVIDRPLVLADATWLPFKNKSIDFLYCNDLAEHIEEPHKFLDECERIARKGAIITPSILAECLFGWDYHAVMFKVRDGRLVIHPKTRTNWGLFEGVFHKLWLEDKDFRAVFARHPELFRMTYEWHDKIDYEYAHSPSSEEQWRRRSSANHTIQRAPSFWELIKRSFRSASSTLLRKVILRRKDTDLKKILCCPDCHGDLSYEAKLISCTKCTRTYRVLKNIPCLLVD